MKNNVKPLRLKRKQTLLGALKTIAYLAGFPLLVLMVGIGSIPFLDFALFGSTWSLSIKLALVLWAAVGVVQIVLACVVRGPGSQWIKTAIVAVVAIVCILGCAVGIDFYGARTMSDINDKYAPTVQQDGSAVAKTVEIPTYRFNDCESETITWTMGTTDISFQTIDYLKGHYVTLTTGFESELDKFKNNVEDFCRIYNVSQNGSLKKKTTDADGNEAVVNSDFSYSKVDAKTGLPVNDNGLVSESYIYSMQFALNVLINYNEAVNAIAALNLDMKDFVAQKDGETAAEYAARLGKMTDAEKAEAVYNHELELIDQSAEYAQYKQSDEYKAAYGDDGTAKKYMLTLERIESMLPILFKYVLFILSYNELTNGFAFDVLDGSFNLANRDAKGNPDPDSLLAAIYKDGDMYENIMAWADDIVPGLIKGQDESLPAAEGRWAEMKVTYNKEWLEGLIEDYFYYYSPSVRPDFDFFGEAKDGDRLIGQITVGTGDDARTFTVQQMRAFAFARYYAKINGAFIGSVLVPNNDAGIGALVNGDGHIGMITLSASGYDASYAYSLAQLYQLKADSEYVPDLFPVLVARRYLYIFAGLVALSILLYYQFGRREDEVIADLATYCQEEGGAQNEN